MAFEEIGGKVTFIKYKEVEVGTEWEGWFEGTGASKQYPDSYSLFIKCGNDKLGLPLSGLLKHLIKDIDKGDYIKVIYQGLSDKKIKGQFPHNFKLMKDPSRSKKGGSEEWEDMNEEDVYLPTLDDEFSDEEMPF